MEREKGIFAYQNKRQNTEQRIQGISIVWSGRTIVLHILWYMFLPPQQHNIRSFLDPHLTLLLPRKGSYVWITSGFWTIWLYTYICMRVSDSVEQCVLMMCTNKMQFSFQFIHYHALLQMNKKRGENIIRNRDLAKFANMFPTEIKTVSMKRQNIYTQREWNTQRLFIKHVWKSKAISLSLHKETVGFLLTKHMKTSLSFKQTLPLKELKETEVIFKGKYLLYLWYKTSCIRFVSYTPTKLYQDFLKVNIHSVLWSLSICTLIIHSFVIIITFLIFWNDI